MDQKSSATTMIQSQSPSSAQTALVQPALEGNRTGFSQFVSLCVGNGMDNNKAIDAALRASQHVNLIPEGGKTPSDVYRLDEVTDISNEDLNNTSIDDIRSQIESSAKECIDGTIILDLPDGSAKKRIEPGEKVDVIRPSKEETCLVVLRNDGDSEREIIRRAKRRAKRRGSKHRRVPTSFLGPKVRGHRRDNACF